MEKTERRACVDSRRRDAEASDPAHTGGRADRAATWSGAVCACVWIFLPRRQGKKAPSLRFGREREEGGREALLLVQAREQKGRGGGRARARARACVCGASCASSHCVLPRRAHARAHVRACPRVGERIDAEGRGARKRRVSVCVWGGGSSNRLMVGACACVRVVVVCVEGRSKSTGCVCVLCMKRTNGTWFERDRCIEIVVNICVISMYMVAAVLRCVSACSEARRVLCDGGLCRAASRAVSWEAAKRRRRQPAKSDGRASHKRGEQRVQRRARRPAPTATVVVIEGRKTARLQPCEGCCFVRVHRAALRCGRRVVEAQKEMIRREAVTFF